MRSLLAARWWVLAVVLLFSLGTVRDASAGKKVDWSEYLEPPGYRAPIRTTSSQRPATAKATKKKAAVSKKKRSRKMAKAKRSKTRSKAAKKAVRSKRRR